MKKQVLIVSILLCIIATVGCRRKPNSDTKPYSDPEVAFSELSNLATLRCDYDIVSAVKPTNGLTADKGLYRYHGSVLLAFDLTKAEFKQDGQKIYITLPDLDIMSPKIDSKWDTVTEKRTLAVSEQKFHDCRNKAEKVAQEKVYEQGKDPDLARTARNQASVLIKSFYASHFPELTVIIK